MPRSYLADEAVPGPRQDVESPVVRIYFRTRIVDASAANLSVEKNRPESVQICTVLLDDLNVETSLRIVRHASFWSILVSFPHGRSMIAFPV
jgi:hypothetical protein